MHLMRATQPLPLYHSWPLTDRSERFDGLRSQDGRHGRWHCDLADNRLTWDEAVFDLFGLPRDVALTRELAVSCYAEGSRAAMERLRDHAIRFRRGFTLDVEVGPPAQTRRWIRLLAAPVLAHSHVVALEGFKLPLDP